MAQVRNFAPARVGVKCVTAGRVGLTMGAAELVGKYPVVICTVRMTNKGVRGFVRCCQQRSISIRECVPGAIAYVPTQATLLEDVMRNGSGDFECIGSLEALEYLTGHPSVVGWQFLEKTANAVDCRASGAGKAK